MFRTRPVLTPAPRRDDASPELLPWIGTALCLFLFVAHVLGSA